MKKKPALMSEYVVCETTAAITTHIRRVDAQHPVKYEGARYGYPPAALCGAKTAWDTKLPLESARCTSCCDKFAALRTLGLPVNEVEVGE
jgi:hypothetical protein